MAKQQEAEQFDEELVMRIQRRNTHGKPECRAVLTITRNGQKTVKRAEWQPTARFYMDYVLLRRDQTEFETKGIGRPMISVGR